MVAWLRASATDSRPLQAPATPKATVINTPVVEEIVPPAIPEKAAPVIESPAAPAPPESTSDPDRVDDLLRQFRERYGRGSQ